MREEQLRSLSEDVWGQIVEGNVRMFLDKDPKKFHVQVDWSCKGFGCLLFAGTLDRGQLVGLNSKGEENN